MNIKELKSMYPISTFKYIWTMITGQHFVVVSIVDGDTKEELDFSEPLITIGKDCFILTDLDSSINSVNKRAPVVIKSLKNKRNEDLIMPGRKSYIDEEDKSVVFAKVSSSYFLDCRISGQNIVLHLKKRGH